MRFSLSSNGLQEWNGDVLAVGLPQGDVDATATALEQRFTGITDALKQQEFKGKPGDQLVITTMGMATLSMGTLSMATAATAAATTMGTTSMSMDTRRRWSTSMGTSETRTPVDGTVCENTFLFMT